MGARHVFRPEDLLEFVELPQFSRRWKQLGLNDEEDLSALQVFLMLAPKSGKVLKGSKGLRKGRFAPARWETGKSGAVRVIYVHFEEFGTILLCLAYGKNETGNISKAVVNHLNRIISEIEGELRRKFSGGDR